ncbi:MAG TPA: response regulator transcription factor [Bacteroidia bacterium]|nr:response regulator transcription factor [Bacteroidia bacterium]
MEPVNVILADDHAIFRKGLAITLRRTGIVDKIFHAENGLDVIEILKNNKDIHVIIMDIRMPELDGIETTRKIRKTNQQIKIVALSMMNDRASINQMFKSGANGYLLKNTNKNELYDAIEQVMLGNRFFASEVTDILFKTDYREMQMRQHQTDELSQSEIDVLKLICYQYSTREISDMLNLSEKTIEGKRKSLLEKTRSKNIAGLVWYAIENGIIKSIE